MAVQTLRLVQVRRKFPLNRERFKWLGSDKDLNYSRQVKLSVCFLPSRHSGFHNIFTGKCVNIQDGLAEFPIAHWLMLSGEEFVCLFDARLENFHCCFHAVLFYCLSNLLLFASNLFCFSFSPRKIENFMKKQLFQNSTKNSFWNIWTYVTVALPLLFSLSLFIFFHPLIGSFSNQDRFWIQIFSVSTELFSFVSFLAKERRLRISIS